MIKIEGCATPLLIMTRDVIQFNGVSFCIMNIDSEKVTVKNIDEVNQYIEMPIDQFIQEFDDPDCGIEKLHYYHDHDILPLSLKFALKQQKII